MAIRASLRAVHPRLRGEHCKTFYALTNAIGSSPPTRGTQLIGLWAGLEGRFIPAYAGNTIPAPIPSTFTAVHHRLRGEHPLFWAIGVSAAGSSPPTRGTLIHAPAATVAARFIPAYAGNTLHQADYGPKGPVHPRLRRNTWYVGRETSASAVHPRLRGEHGGGVGAVEAGFGSSPPTRGTQ